MGTWEQHIYTQSSLPGFAATPEAFARHIILVQTSPLSFIPIREHWKSLAMATRNYPIIMPTHPPEQTLRWSKMVKSNPKRVADALVVQLNIGKNSWGDTTDVSAFKVARARQ